MKEKIIFVLASNNKKKIAEMQRILSEAIKSFSFTLLSLDEAGCAGEIEETGTTFNENALLKANVPASHGYIGIADDSGLCVDAIGGAPGVYSARYAEENGITDDKKNRAKLLNALKDIPHEKRTARFKTAIACVFPSQYGIEPLICEGVCEGIIIDEERGEGGFGYDSVFVADGFDKTFAEITSEQKDKVSHRGKALRLFAQTINNINERL